MTTPTPYIFPFGRPVAPCKPSADGKRSFFVLGAYPSALHVKWTPPVGFKPIAAIAVDNEPSPFWTGEDESKRIEAWMRAVEWRAEWGSIAGVGRLNGSSGKWVKERVLDPLGATHADTWITDALDTYRCSVDLAVRLEDTYKPFAADMKLPLHALAQHPSEHDIVSESVREHRERLERELATAQPEVIVTLGNAALRAFTGLVEVVGEEAPKKLAVDAYGRALNVNVAGRPAKWVPLAHPAAPKVYQAAHRDWIASR